MKRAITLLGLASLTAATLAATAIARPAEATAPAAFDAVSCSTASLGFAGPLTGPAAFLGQEQLSWSKFAAVQYNKQNKTTFKIVQGDTQLSASLARTVGRQFVSNKNILGVIGPSTSQAVISSAGLFKTAALAAVSGSATRTDLTTAGKFPTFFRVVPNDFVQAPSIVNFSVKTLKAKHVVVVDSQDDYSTALAKGVTYRFHLKGVKVDRESVAATDTDFSSLVTNVANDVQVVVFATQTAAAAQTMSQQLREQGKRAVVLGTDGAYSPGVFKPRLGYVSSFAPDIRLVKGGAAVVKAYNAYSNMLRSMQDHPRPTRAEVTANVKHTNVPSILGGQVRFTSKGDVAGAKFYVFKITSGKYTLAG